MGSTPARDALVLLWHTPDQDADWTVEYQAGDKQAWTKVSDQSYRTVAMPGVEPHRVYARGGSKA